MPNLNRHGVLKLAGTALTAISCIPILATLPGGIVTILALIGITATSPPIVALAAPLAPVAQQLLLVSIAMLIAGHLRCGWPPALLAATGGLLIYLAMYVFVMPAPAIDHTAMETMSGMPSTTTTADPGDGIAGMTDAAPSVKPMEQTPRMSGLTNGLLFYMGLASLLSSFGLGWWRQRRNACQPLHPLRALRTTLGRRA